MNVLFIHENTLGHSSYLPQFVNYLAAHPELDIVPELLLATPLPPELARKADKTVPFLRRFGLDMHFSRWRKIVSGYVRSQVLAKPPNSFDAIVINTQSVALDLIDIQCPMFVSLDATFHQQAGSRWFSEIAMPNIAPRLVSALIKRERALFERASALFPWSSLAAKSLLDEYKTAREKVHILPPSLEMPPPRQNPKHETPRALFVGADFKRKGGDVLLESFRSFRGQLELDILTRSPVPPESGVRLWRNIEAHTPAWETLWNDASFFIFPSLLETFGIVLVEALAFELPVIASRTGAADEILDYGKAGYLLDAVTPDDLSLCIDAVLSDFPTALNKARAGRKRAETEYELARNTTRLAGLLHQYAR
jgi:glycosyltransferase involved in cell wall biosynthesis